MARFIAISGPSSTGKTSLIESLSTYPELSRAAFSPDLFISVWSDLVKNGYFSEWKELNTDSEYLCVYIIRLLDYYENYINSYEDTDKLVILDGCWLDLAIYAMINLWYNKGIKEVQESILARLHVLDSKISKIYMTSFDESKHTVMKYRAQYKMANVKINRPLEIQYYKIFSTLRNAELLPTTDISDASIFIMNDLRKLGYV